MKVKGMPDLSLPPPSPEASSFFSVRNSERCFANPSQNDCAWVFVHFVFQGGMSTRFAASAPATSFMHQAQKSRFDPSPQGEELGKSPTVLSYVGSLSKRKVSFGGKDAEEGKASIGSGSIASVSSILGRDLTMPLGSIDEGFEDGMFPLPARAGTTSNPELDKSTLKLEQFKLSAGAPSKPIPFVRQVSDFSDPGRVSDRGEEEDTSSSSEDDDDSRPTVEDEGVFMFESDM